MKCVICKKEHGLSVFTGIKSLRGICYYCYKKLPEHIPHVQAKRWLWNEMYNL